MYVELTLDDGQQDYNDKEEECDVKDDAVDFVLVTCRVLYLIANPSTCSYTNIHVEHVALEERVTEIQNSARERKRPGQLIQTQMEGQWFDPEFHKLDGLWVYE